MRAKKQRRGSNESLLLLLVQSARDRHNHHHYSLKAQTGDEGHPEELRRRVGFVEISESKIFLSPADIYIYILSLTRLRKLALSFSTVESSSSFNPAS